MKRNPLAVVLLVVVVFLGLWLGWTKFKLSRATTRVEEVSRERDKLSSDAAAERARADGWAVMFGDSTDDLRDQLEEKDSAFARLAADLHASRVRLGYLAEVNVSLRNTVVSFGEPVDSTADAPPDRWAGSFDDGLLRAEWSFVASLARLGLDPYAVSIDGELVGAEDGSGRHVVFGRASDPRVTLSIGRYTFEPAPPVVRDRCSWTRQGLTFLGGFGSAVLLGR